MRNRWNVETEPVLGWSARMRDESLVEVLRAAQENGVLRVLRASHLGYDHRTDSRSYAEFVSAAALPDALAPLDAADDERTRVAYYGPDGAAIEDDVSDLGAVLDATAHTGLATHRPALSLWAGRDSGNVVELRVSSYSDIWLPWCSTRFEAGAGEDDAHEEDLADNRELAARHTPRLNAFLARVAELARENGDRMRVEPDNTLYLLRFQIDDHGVRLDVENPRERTAWERFGKGREVADALLAAAAAARLRPPPAPYRAAVGVWSTDDGHPLFRASRDAVRDAVRATGIASVLDGSTRVTVLTHEVQYRFEPDELAP